jgi:protein ImuB
MIVCVLYLRFALLAALGGRQALLGQPVVLAPEPGRRQVVGEVSAGAEAFGVSAGMRVGEALARCPDLRLVQPDPDGVRSAWRRVLDLLAGIGAECESDREGIAYFGADGLRGMHGGRLDGVLEAARGAVGRGARIGCAPSRFSAHAAALHARPRRRAAPAPGIGLAISAPGTVTVPAGAVRAFLAPLPVGLLRTRPELAELPDVLERLGIRTLGELGALPRAAVAQRFGHPGRLALDLAQGGDTPLEARRPAEPVGERIDLPDAALGPQLERALELLLGRLLARRERRGRTVRALALSARFVEGGTWRTRITLRRASAEADRILVALTPKLAHLPAPAEALGLEIEAFGPPAYDQGRLLGESPAAVRSRRIADAVGQARQAAGSDAALRVLEVDPDSRLPERRAVLAPFQAGGRPPGGRS